MSAGSDNVFARWSRRKQAMRNGTRPLSHEVERASDPDARQADGRDPEPRGRQLSAEPNAAKAEPAIPVEPPPRLADLTAESDLSAFLREGVPKALKSAAMRRMWSLDPAIRDYIGPSEYAWDFNQPGSMAGFGPLAPNDKMVADFVSTMSARMRTGPAEAASSNERSPSPLTAAPSCGEEEARPSPDLPVDAVSSEGSLKIQSPPADLQSHSLDPTEPAAAEPAEAAEPIESRRCPRPRHGRAMPR